VAILLILVLIIVYLKTRRIDRELGWQ